MTTSDEFGPLLQRAALGDEAAAELILQEFAPKVLRAVRLRLNRKLRRDFDSTDFVQAVWMSFFDGLSGVERFADTRALCGYLTKMAERKVLMGIRRQGRQKRDVSRERPMESDVVDNQPIVSPTDTPSERMVAFETWEKLLSSLPLHHQRILSLRAEGYTQGEIAETLKVSEITVRRVIAAMKKVAELKA
jgi:RNA polymerase sigma factor (sigma-70 family)